MAEKRKREELRSRETEEHGTAEKRNRADLISGGTEWICLEVIRRGMDANCRETDERSRAVKSNVWRRNGSD